MTATRVEASRDWLSRFFGGDTFAYISKRLLQAILTLFLVSLLSFLISQLAPGNYLDTLRENPKNSPQFIAQLNQQLALDKPWHVQYWHWLWQILSQGNFGPSLIFQRPAASLIGERIPATLLLALSSLVITWAVAIPMGIIAAVKQNHAIDRFLRLMSYGGQGFPSFITALLLLFLAQNTSPLFPVGGITSINFDDLTLLGKFLDVGWHMILPTLALCVSSFAGLQRITRGELLDVLRQDYIQTARAKGLPENRVIYVHALRNAVNPLVTLLGFELAGLLSGSFIVENFFNWPGLGQLLLQAVTAKDIYLVMAGTMMGAVLLIVGNLLADLLLKAVDPRIRLEKLN